MKNFTLQDRKEFLDNIQPKEGFDLKFVDNFDRGLSFAGLLFLYCKC